MIEGVCPQAEAMSADSLASFDRFSGSGVPRKPIVVLGDMSMKVSLSNIEARRLIAVVSAAACLGDEPLKR
jgi:hypothetical protein